jgi:cytoskeletal protein CcmA (bactofilin family)
MKRRCSYLILGLAVSLGLASAVGFGGTRPVQAAEIRTTGVLNSGETIDDDLIISGNTVRVDGTVNGLLIAAGSNVTVNGTINGDAILLGQDVTLSDKATVTGNVFSGARSVIVNGNVNGSIAAGSASMGTNAKVGRNIYYGGYSLETQAGSDVARSLYFGGYQAVLKGKIARDLQASGGALEIDGAIGGDAQVEVASPGQNTGPIYFGPGAQMPASIPSGLRVGPNAKIGGKLLYTSPVDQSAAVQAAPAGGIVYQTPVPKERAEQPRAVRVVMPFLNWFVAFLRNFITLLLLGLLAVWLIPVIVNRTSEIARLKTLQSAGYGLLTIIVGYVGAAIAIAVILALGLFLTLITLGGLSRTVFGLGFTGLAFVFAVFILLVSYASKLVVAYLIGDLILAAIAPTLSGRRYWAMALGVLIYALLRAIPFLGWIIAVLVTITGVGALWLYYRSRTARPGIPVAPVATP